MAKKYTIGEKVKRARIHAEMDYNQLASASGLSTVAIRNLEKNKVHNPHLDTIARIAKGTKVKLSWFYQNLDVKEIEK